jgi:hypothetical protein
MNAQEILIEAEKFGVTLVVVDGKLKATPPGALPPDLKSAVLERVDEIKARLSASAFDSATETSGLNRPACPACHGCDLRVSPTGGLVCRGCGRFLFLHAVDAPAYPALPCAAVARWSAAIATPIVPARIAKGAERRASSPAALDGSGLVRIAPSNASRVPFRPTSG